MVTTLPQVLVNYRTLQNSIQITDRISDEWDRIEDSGTGFLEFAEKYALLPRKSRNEDEVRARMLGHANYPREAPDLSEGDYIGIRDVLNFAARLRALALRGDVTQAELADYGICPHYLIEREGDYIEQRKLSHLSYEWATCSIPIKGETYIDYLNCLDNTDSMHFVEEREDESDVLVLRLPSWWQGTEEEEAGCFDSLVEIALMQLIDIHLMHVKTCSGRYGIPHQEAPWGISALWLSYCNRFSGARIAFCKGCGRPIFVTGERGTPREYCGEKCRSWARRHPGEVRGLRTSLKKR